MTGRHLKPLAADEIINDIKDFMRRMINSFFEIGCEVRFTPGGMKWYHPQDGFVDELNSDPDWMNFYLNEYNSL